ncbi:hypothetical protein JCM10212_000004 [Sporobolomyces blumeae]
MPIPLRIGALSLPTTVSLANRCAVALSLLARASSAAPASSSHTSRSGSVFATWQAASEAPPIQRVLGYLVRREADSAAEGASGQISRQEFAIKLALSILFVLLGGCFSGLSLGLMGLDQMNLKVLATSGPPQDRHDARKVLSLLSHGRHFVLVSLLLSNVIVNETLPIFLDSITGGGGLLAVAISSILIFIAGEVLPQSLCSLHGLRIGAKCVGFVRLLMYLESPVCWPTAKLLDWLLGTSHSHAYTRQELATLVELHSIASFQGNPAPATATTSASVETLDEVEVDLVRNVLSLRDHRVDECMKRLDRVYSVNDGMRICDVDLREVMLRSQPYVPVRRARLAQSSIETAMAHEGIFVGLITMQQIVAGLSTPNETIRTLPLTPLVQVLPSTPIPDCLTYLNEYDRSTVFLVSNSSVKGSEALGFATETDLSTFLVDSAHRVKREQEVLSIVTPSRTPMSRGRAGSMSLGLGGFVKGVVARHRTHRASASSLSFRLSDDDDDGASTTDHVPLRTSHSHHRTTSRSSLRSDSRPRPTSGSFARTVARARPATGAPSFKFPSPVFEEREAFALGADDDESDEASGSRERLGRTSSSVIGRG